jgi:hypothetical protein
MKITEKFLSLPISPGAPDFLDQVQNSQRFRIPGDAAPIRFVVTKSDADACECEVGILEGLGRDLAAGSLFDFKQCGKARNEAFNAVFIVPTGIGAEIGGHAGDATPAVRMLAGICDNLITHPNTVNASDLNEMTENTLYVEGSVLTRFLMGTVGLGKVRSNRVLAIIDDHEDEIFVHAAVNAVNAARASFGLDCPKVIKMERPVRMSAEYAGSGRAAGRVENFAALCEVLKRERGSYDAIAIASVIDVPQEYHEAYFGSGGEMVNPWGGVEALLTHSISSLFNVPSAHSPMLETREIANADTGIVEPRLAAEAVSMAFLHCILKGLHRSPAIVTDPAEMTDGATLSAKDVSCLVIPDGCLGLPTLAALHQGIPVIAVVENANLMQNDLSALPWSEGQYFEVNNYLEAAGLMAAMRAGVDPATVRRPLAPTVVEHISHVDDSTVEKHRTVDGAVN